MSESVLLSSIPSCWSEGSFAVLEHCLRCMVRLFVCKERGDVDSVGCVVAAAIVSMHKIQYFKGAISSKSKFHGV